MSWYDYIANQSGAEISVECNWNTGKVVGIHAYISLGITFTTDTYIHFIQ